MYVLIDQHWFSVGTWETSSEARTPAPENVARRLGIESGNPTVRTAYEFLADGKPAQLSVSWEPLAITGGTPILLARVWSSGSDPSASTSKRGWSSRGLPGRPRSRPPCSVSMPETWF